MIYFKYCMICDKKFTPEGRYQRLCPECRNQRKFSSWVNVPKVNFPLVLFLMVVLIGIASASLGTFQQDTCVEIRTILNETAVNISSISYPNNTVVYLNTPMTKNAQTFNYTYCGTDLIGEYIYDYYSASGEVYVNDFVISYTGDSLDVGKAIIYSLMLAITIGFWFLVLFYTTKLPSKDSQSEEGLIQISKLKYLRDALFGVLWALTIAILFLASNIAIAYLPFQMFGEFLFALFLIMGYLTAPMVILWTLWIFYRLVTDSKLKRFMERGGDFDGGQKWV